MVSQIARVQPFILDPISSSTLNQPAIFNEFLKWCKGHRIIGSTTFVAHSSTSFVGLTHFNSLGSWILDSGATYHITSNKSFFFLLCLPPVIYHMLPWIMALGLIPWCRCYSSPSFFIY